MKNLLIGLISFAFGIFATIFIKKISSLTISNTINLGINPLEILTLLITIFLAVYVTRTLSKKNDKEKEEKQLIIKFFNEFNSILKSKVFNILEQDNYDTLLTKAAFKFLRKKLKSIIDIAIKYEYIDKGNSLGIDLKNNLTDIWELLTDTPKKIEDTDKPDIVKSIEKLRLENSSKVQAKLILIDELIYEIISTINRK